MLAVAGAGAWADALCTKPPRELFPQIGRPTALRCAVHATCANTMHACPQLLCALPGSLHSLLGQGRATLHCYRWQATTTTAGQAQAGPGEEAAAGQEADPMLRELLTHLQQLGLLLLEPLATSLPDFALSAPAPHAASVAPAAAAEGPSSAAANAAAAGGAGAGPPSAQAEPGGGGSAPDGSGSATGTSSPASIRVRLVPAGTVDLSCEQQQLLLGCSHALLAHMFARGSYCGAAGKLVAADRPPRQSGAQAAGCATQGDARSSAAGAGANGAAAADRSPRGACPELPLPAPAPEAEHDASMPDAAPVQEHTAVQPGQRSQETEAAAASAGPAAVAGPEAHDMAAAEAAAAAQRLAQDAVHHVLLLHDGRGVPRSKRQRCAGPAGSLPAGAAMAAEAGFLLAPLSAARDVTCAAAAGRAGHGAGGSCGSSLQDLIDWPVVQDIAAAAGFEGTLLDWLHSQEAGTALVGQPTAGCQAAGTQAGTSLVDQALQGRVLVTTYNNSAYLYRWGRRATSGRRAVGPLDCCRAIGLPLSLQTGCCLVCPTTEVPLCVRLNA